MDKVGPLLNGVATLVVGIGVLVVLLKTGGLIAVLGGRLNLARKVAEEDGQN